LGPSIFDRPFIAVFFGLIIGFVMMAVVVFLPNLEKTGDILKRWPYAFAGILVAFLIGSGAIFAYHALAPHSFVWFGLTAVVVFCILIVVKAIPQIRQLKRRI